LGWAFDTTLVLMNGIVFLSLAYVERSKDNVRIEFLIRELSPRTRRVLGLFQNTVGVTGYALIGYKCTLYSLKAIRSGWIFGQEAQIPLWLPYSAIAVGSFLLCFRLLIDMIGTSILASQHPDDSLKETA
jgi:TRAP-type C4-dicarboxylate transport system permease small subunit